MIKKKKRKKRREILTFSKQKSFSFGSTQAVSTVIVLHSIMSREVLTNKTIKKTTSNSKCKEKVWSKAQKSGESNIFSPLFSSLLGGRQYRCISTVLALSGLSQPGRMTVVTLRPSDSGRLDMEMMDMSLVLSQLSKVKQCHTELAWNQVSKELITCWNLSLLIHWVTGLLTH